MPKYVVDEVASPHDFLQKRTSNLIHYPTQSCGFGSTGGRFRSVRSEHQWHNSVLVQRVRYE